MEWTHRAFFIVLTLVVAIGIGLLLRHLVLRRFKITFLDNWLLQALSIIVLLLPLLLALEASFTIWDSNTFVQHWNDIKHQFGVSSLTDLTWYLVWHIAPTVLIGVLGVGVARTVMTLTVRGLGENRIDINTRTLIGRIFYILTLITAAFWILSIWQISIGLPIAILGTLTVAFAFSIQDLLKDLVAGFYILMERPFHIGDLITIGDQVNNVNHTGHVEDVQIRATKLRLITGEQVTVPNAVVFGGSVINNSYYGERRSTISITLLQDAFQRHATLQQIIEMLQHIEKVMVKPEPEITMSGYTGNQVTITLHFWIANGHISTLSEVMYALHDLLPHADLAVKEPGGDI